MRVIGLTGWSGAGKTTLMLKLIPALRARGLSISTVKHSHHSMEIDKPGKDSYEHRSAGAEEVVVASNQRWALIRELRGEAEPTLVDLLSRMSRVDLVLVEGYKSGPQPKIELFRAENGKPPLHPGDPTFVAIAADMPFPASGLPVIDINDVEALAEAVLTHAVLRDSLLEG